MKLYAACWGLKVAEKCGKHCVRTRKFSTSLDRIISNQRWHGWHGTFNQCWVDVGPPSPTLVQHQPNIGPTWCVSQPVILLRSLPSSSCRETGFISTPGSLPARPPARPQLQPVRVTFEWATRATRSPGPGMASRRHGDDYNEKTSWVITHAVRYVM